jgi:hypothetical protein
MFYITVRFDNKVINKFKLKSLNTAYKGYYNLLEGYKEWKRLGKISKIVMISLSRKPYYKMDTDTEIAFAIVK